MTREEYDKLNLDQLDEIILSKSADDKVLDAAYIAIMDGNDDIVLAFINGDSSALNEYINGEAPAAARMNASPTQIEINCPLIVESQKAAYCSETSVKMYQDGAALQKAFELYEQAEYSKAFDKCIAIIEKDGPDFKTNLLLARAFLLMTDWDNWPDNKDSFFDAAVNALKLASTVNEAIEADYQIRHSIRVWDTRQHRIMLDRLEKNTSRTTWKDYLMYQQRSMIVVGLMIVTLRDQEHVKKLYLAEGLTEDQFNDMCNERSVTDVFPTDEINSIIFNIGYAHFESTVNAIEENKVASADFLSVFGAEALDRLSIADLIISSAIEATENKEQLLQYLYAQANVKRYMLEAKLHPNGGTLSLLCDDRSEEINKLKQVYQKIQQINPSFSIPAMPERYGTKSYPQGTIGYSGVNNTGGGGCYVATAVYGSYDCPEVWTLRRFRDNILAGTWYGRVFIRTYYAISPILVKRFGNTAWFKKMWKTKLDKMVESLKKRGVESTPYQDISW